MQVSGVSRPGAGVSLQADIGGKTLTPREKVSAFRLTPGR